MIKTGKLTLTQHYSPSYSSFVTFSNFPTAVLFLVLDLTLDLIVAP